MKTIGKGKVQKTLNTLAETWDAFTEFKEAIGFSDYGVALDGLLDFYLRFKDQLKTAEGREADADQALSDAQAEVSRVQIREEELNQRERELAYWEKQQAEDEGVGYLPLVAAKRLLESGLGVQDIQDLGEIVTSSGLAASSLAQALKEIGGASVLRQELMQDIENLRTRKDTMSSEFIVLQVELKDKISAATMHLADLQGQTTQAEEYKQGVLTETDQVAGDLRQSMAYWDQAYRLLGVTFETMKVHLGKVDRLELLPLNAQLFLAGSILVMAQQIWGDRTWTLEETAENIYPIRLRLSEIPLLFAPPEAYGPQVELVRKQLRCRDQYRKGSVEELLGTEADLGEEEPE